MIDFSKYPRATRFLKEHPEKNLDEALAWSENEIKKLEEKNKHHEVGGKNDG